MIWNAGRSIADIMALPPGGLIIHIPTSCSIAALWETHAGRAVKALVVYQTPTPSAKYTVFDCDRSKRMFPSDM